MVTFENLERELNGWVKNADDFIEKSPQILEQLREEYDNRVKELHDSVERAYKLKDECQAALQLMKPSQEAQ